MSVHTQQKKRVARLAGQMGAPFRMGAVAGYAGEARPGLTMACRRGRRMIGIIRGRKRLRHTPNGRNNYAPSTNIEAVQSGQYRTVSFTRMNARTAPS